MNDLLSITKALSDENRVRIVAALAPGELCVCQLVELLELAPSTVSKHLALLRQAGLLLVRKDGRWAYYRRAGREASRIVRGALAFVDTSLADDARTDADTRRLEEILTIDPEVLCCQQRGAPVPDEGRTSPASRTTRRRSAS